MALLETELGSFIFNVILTIAMVIFTKHLWTSAQSSLKNSGGKWSSIVDEIIWFLVGLAVCLICWNMGIVSAANTAVMWIQWLWKLVSPVLRNLGFPV